MRATKPTGSVFVHNIPQWLTYYAGLLNEIAFFRHWIAVWTDIHRIRHNVRRDEHPCQLPIHLLERLVLMSTDQGDVVLDPFLGTGTTAIAAKTLGRHFVGIDLDPEYAQIATAKLDQVTETTFQGYYVSFFLGQIASIRDCDAAQVFPAQLTSVEKKRQRGNNGHQPEMISNTVTLQATLLEDPVAYSPEQSDEK